MQAALGLEILVGAHRGGVLDDVVNGGHAAFKGLPHGEGDAQLALVGVEVRHHGRHDALSALVQDASGLAGLGVSLDGAAGRIGPVPIDSRQRQPAGVGHGDVGAEGDGDRVFGEVVASGETLVLHAEVLHRAPMPRYPVARGSRGGLFGQTREHLGDGVDRPVEVPDVHQLPVRQTVVGQMNVGIGQSRNDGQTLEVHLPRIGPAQPPHFVGGTDGDDAPAGTGHRLGHGRYGSKGAYLSIEEHRIGIGQVTSSH